MIIVPRLAGEGPNDQIEMANRIAEKYNIPLCLEIENIEPQFQQLLAMKDINLGYDIENNVSSLIAAYLASN